jgi:hypothetical protein
MAGELMYECVVLSFGNQAVQNSGYDDMISKRILQELCLGNLRGALLAGLGCVSEIFQIPKPRNEIPLNCFDGGMKHFQWVHSMMSRTFSIWV